MVLLFLGISVITKKRRERELGFVVVDQVFFGYHNRQVGHAGGSKEQLRESPHSKFD
jgi:hypothetical protein